MCIPWGWPAVSCDNKREQICGAFSLHHFLWDQVEVRLCLVASPHSPTLLPSLPYRILLRGRPQSQVPCTEILVSGFASRELVLWHWPMIVLHTRCRTTLVTVVGMDKPKFSAKHLHKFQMCLKQSYLEQDMPVLFGAERCLPGTHNVIFISKLQLLCH